MASESARTAGGGMRGDGLKASIRSRVVVASLLAVGLVVGCGGWAASAKLGGAVIAHGQVAVRKQVKQVQHRDGGIVAEILVANGDAVREGDVLIRLDETQTRAELGVILSQLTEHKGRRARLAAERDALEAIVFEEDFEADPRNLAVVAGETRLFENNREMRRSQHEQLTLQVAQLEDQIRGLESQQASNAGEAAMIEDDLARLRPLRSKGLIEGTKIRELERDLTQIRGVGGEIEANIALVLGQVSEKRMRVLELDQAARTDAQRELRDIEARISELQERHAAAIDRMSRMEMRAPISGWVNDLTAHTVGGVVAPGDRVMSIVPRSEDLVVEARLSPADIDQVTAGRPVKLRFSAFNQRTTPEIMGRVSVVGAAASRDPSTGEFYYQGEIAITEDVSKLGAHGLVPGMPVEVFVSTGERTALSYLVKPFTDQMEKAFREE